MVNLKIMKKNLKLMKILKKRGIIFGLLLISSFSFFISNTKALVYTTSGNFPDVPSECINWAIYKSDVDNGDKLICISDASNNYLSMYGHVINHETLQHGYIPGKSHSIYTSTSTDCHACGTGSYYRLENNSWVYNSNTNHRAFSFSILYATNTNLVMTYDTNMVVVNANFGLTSSNLMERNTHNIYKNDFTIDLVIPNSEIKKNNDILFKLSLDNTFNLNNNTFSYQILKYSNHEFLEIGNDENISIEDISLDLDNVINTDENLFNINASYTGVATGFFVITDELIISTESSGSYAYIVFDTQYHLNNFFLSYNALDTSRLLLLPYNSSNELLTNITIENFSFNTYYNSYYLDINDTKVLQSIILPEEVSYFKIGFVANKDNTLSDIRLFSNTGSNVSSAMNLSGKVHFDSNTSYANDYVLRFTIDNSIFKDITLYDNMSYNLWSLIDVSEYKYVTSFNSNSSDTQGELSQIELNITNTLDYNIYDNLIELIPNNYDSVTPTLSFVEVYKCNNDIFGNCVKDESTKVNIDKNQYYNSSSIYSNIIFNSKGEYKIVYNFNNTSNATFNIYDLGRTDTLTYKAIPTDFKGYKRINFSGAYDTLLLSSDSSKSFEIFVPSNSIINPNISLIVNSYDYLNNAIVNSYTPMDYLSNSYYSYYELDLDYDNNLVVLLTKLRSSENVIIYVPNDVVTTFGTTKDNTISTPNGNITIDVPPSSEDLIDSTNDFKYFFDYVDSSLESLKEARDTINDLYNYFYDSLPPILKIFHNVALIVLCLVIFIKVGVGQ